MIYVSNSLYILIDKYFPPKPKCYHGHNLFGDIMILLLLAFVLIEQMVKEGEYKLIMGCERGRNYKNEKSSQVTCSRRFNWPFKLRYVPSGSGWNIMTICGIHNHDQSKDLGGHNILGHVKLDERQFVNDMTIYQ